MKDKGNEKISRQLDILIAEVRNLTQAITRQTQQGAATVASIEELQAEVSQNTDAVGSAVTLINGLAQQIRDAVAQNDPAALQAVVDQLEANSSALAQAVAENTTPPPA